MNEKTSMLTMLTELLDRVIGDVFASASHMQSTIIAAAAFGGFCLFLYRVVDYYRALDHDLWSREHALALTLIIIAFFILPTFGVAFAGIYGITNLVAAWQIGLTTPMLIESAYIAYGKKAAKGEYGPQFLPSQLDA